MFEKVLVLSLPLVLILTTSASADCPKSNGALKRLGQTRYYIIHDNKQGDYVNFDKAQEECRKHGLNMATVKNLMALRVAGRELEKIAAEQKLQDTWYWIDAKYNPQTKTYTWSNRDELKYTLFHYRHPRPIGIGTHINFNNKYEPDTNNSFGQCLTLALPLAGSNESSIDASNLNGHKTSFDERDCLSDKSRHAICESLDKNCDKKETSPYKMHEGQSDYFYSGNWIYGDRTYVANFKQITGKENKAYCESLGLVPLSASDADAHLTPHLKMWTRALNLNQFWTSMKFNTETGKFLDSQGKEITNSLFGPGTEVVVDANAATPANLDKELCVAVSISYDFNENISCSDSGSPDCKWSFFRYIPANCNNYHGSICQHKDHTERKITWYPEYKNNLKTVMEKTALTSEFGYPGNTLVQRSKYKQTFGIFYCPDKYRPARSDKNEFTSWSVKPVDESEFYEYDYLETYWVIDEEIYDKTENSLCTVSYLDNKQRKFKQVSCSEWHFYLCIHKDRRPQRKIAGKVNEAPQMEWKSDEQPRLFPIFHGGRTSSKPTTKPSTTPRSVLVGITTRKIIHLKGNPKMVKKTGVDHSALIEKHIHNMDSSVEVIDKVLGKRENRRGGGGRGSGGRGGGRGGGGGQKGRSMAKGGKGKGGGGRGGGGGQKGRSMGKGGKGKNGGQKGRSMGKGGKNGNQRGKGKGQGGRSMGKGGKNGNQRGKGKGQGGRSMGKGGKNGNQRGKGKGQGGRSMGKGGKNGNQRGKGKGQAGRSMNGGKNGNQRGRGKGQKGRSMNGGKNGNQRGRGKGQGGRSMNGGKNGNQRGRGKGQKGRSMGASGSAKIGYYDDKRNGNRRGNRNGQKGRGIGDEQEGGPNCPKKNKNLQGRQDGDSTESDYPSQENNSTENYDENDPDGQERKNKQRRKGQGRNKQGGKKGQNGGEDEEDPDDVEEDDNEEDDTEADCSQEDGGMSASGECNQTLDGRNDQQGARRNAKGGKRRQNGRQNGEDSDEMEEEMEQEGRENEGEPDSMEEDDDEEGNEQGGGGKRRNGQRKNATKKGCKKKNGQKGQGNRKGNNTRQGDQDEENEEGGSQENEENENGEQNENGEETAENENAEGGNNETDSQGENGEGGPDENGQEGKDGADSKGENGEGGADENGEGEKKEDDSNGEDDKDAKNGTESGKMKQAGRGFGLSGGASFNFGADF